jgi:hypothetical protein
MSIRLQPRITSEDYDLEPPPRRQVQTYSPLAALFGGHRASRKPRRVLCSVRPDEPFESPAELSAFLGVTHSVVDRALRRGQKVKGYDVRRV